MNDLRDILNSKDFDNMSQEVKEGIINLQTSIKGKSIDQSLPYIVKFMKSLPKNYQFTTKQKDILLSVVSENLSDKEKKQLYMLLSMLGFK